MKAGRNSFEFQVSSSKFFFIPVVRAQSTKKTPNLKLGTWNLKLVRNIFPRKLWKNLWTTRYKTYELLESLDFWHCAHASGRVTKPSRTLTCIRETESPTSKVSIAVDRTRLPRRNPLSFSLRHASPSSKHSHPVESGLTQS